MPKPFRRSTPDRRDPTRSKRARAVGGGAGAIPLAILILGSSTSIGLADPGAALEPASRGEASTGGPVAPLEATSPARTAAVTPASRSHAASRGEFAAESHHPERPDTLRDLRALLDVGWILNDASGDDVVDRVDVRIVVPDAPSEAEAVVAANVAARLGFESSATRLGYLTREGEIGAGALAEPVVLVGEGGALWADAGVPTGAARERMAPSEGAIAFLPANSRLGRGGVALLGYDATGLLAAGGYASSRYPSIWDVDGATWDEVAVTLEAFAEARGASPGDVTLDRIVVHATEAGVARAGATIRTGDRETFDALIAALLGGEESGGSEGPAGAAADTTGAAGAGDPARIEGDEPEAIQEGGPPTHSTLRFRDLHRLDVRVVGPDETRTIPVRPEEPWNTASGRAAGAGPDPSFSLPEAYEVGGFYRDTNRDLVPDETAAYLSVAGGAAAEAVADLAARIGLETAGARFPLARVAGEGDFPEELGFPIVIGADHYQVGRLQEEGHLPGWIDDAGLGSVRIVEGAFNDRSGLVIAGADEAGTSAAVEWLARRAPYLWEHGKGSYRLADAETHVRRFLQTREAPGQAALALHKLGTWMDRLADAGSMAGGPLPSPGLVTAPDGADDPGGRSGEPDRVEVEIAVERAESGLDRVAEALVRERFPGAEIDVATHSTGFGVGDTVYARTFDVPWEVDAARRVLEERVYPRVMRGRPASVELRVSEPPEIRAALEEEIRGELAGRGASQATVSVLNAYKQGYSWMYDEVLPRLLAHDGEPIGAIEIEYHTLEESEEIRWQTVAADTRWLQELYPIDAVLARDLGIAASAVTFRARRRADPIYAVTVTGASGDTILADTFQPRYVVRPFFDLFPEYEQVRVTTGWLTASADGATLVDERVVTDPEAFWDVLQTDVYGAMIEYVMDIQDGRPASGNAPFFDEFTVDLALSEPNHRIGIDEEVISSLEALHEDIYFETLTLFDLIGDRYGVGGLDYPGRVLPYIDPDGAGAPGRATVTITGKARGVPELVARVRREGTADVEYRRYPLGALPVPEPALTGVTAGGDRSGPPIRRLLFEVEVTDSLDRYDEYRARTSEGAIDRTFLSVELLEGLVEQLRALHEAGLYTGTLAWDRVAETALLLRVEETDDYHRVVRVARTTAPTATDPPRLVAEGWTHDGRPIVQWDTPIPPAESDSVLAKLNTFPGVDVYFMTRSYLGQPVWVADFLPTDAGLERGYVSQAKLNALKPTLFISGRQHANEVSSTSHILRLAELLVTDSTYRSYLDDVNVVLHPITNPDGARLAVEMQETNPDFMLHAGYLGALGVDATSGERSDDPVYPESQVRRRVRETWLPDAYVNMHGYPSHEWVQYFAGYSAWVRSRRGGQRDWWSPRGWFVPGFGWTDDDENPEYREAAFAMLDSVTASITADPDVRAMNERLYGRYRKYGTEDRENFREYFHNGVLAYVSLRGAESIGTGPFSRRITYFSTTTEAPDETARGDWLKLVASAGLAHSSALLRYLAAGEYEVERENEAFDGAVMRKVFRVRPVLPPDPDADDPGGSAGDEGG